MRLLLLPLMYTDMLPIRWSGTAPPEWSNLYAPSINKGKRKGKPHIWALSSFGISNFYTERMRKNAQKSRYFKEIPGFCFGGEGGIWTLDTLLGYTRFPIVRARPATRLLQLNAVLTAWVYYLILMNLSTPISLFFWYFRRNNDKYLLTFWW